ncbi:MAG: GNAT family N-acetyltransferase [Ardenticatenaceae bacterium]|nr:GNAT family N-acetyltransferase [Ardenticatenaceae bacterium]HBY98853.1 hypothetical protein [Chloroflexota bacterium]
MFNQTKERYAIRRASRTDAEALRALRHTVGWSAARIEHQLADPAALVLVAEVEEILIGTITLMSTHDDPELADRCQRAYISDLMVAPRWQRYGFGGALLAAAEDEARARGYSTVTLTVDESNEGARRLYERCGYRWFKTVRFPWGPGHALAKHLGGDRHAEAWW